MNSKYFRPFPAYEDVFYDDIETHERYFLPICSVNLQCINPKRDEWVHFISAKEIYEGALAEHTLGFHTDFSKADMFAFDIIDGKYKFEADWNYFYINHGQNIEKNTRCFADFKKQDFTDFTHFNTWLSQQHISKGFKEELTRLAKSKVFKFLAWDGSLQYDAIFPYIESTFTHAQTFNELASAYQKNTAHYVNAKNRFAKTGQMTDAEYFGFIDDIQLQSEEFQEALMEDDIDDDFIEETIKENIEESAHSKEQETSIDDLINLTHVPKDNEGNMLEYMGCLTGYDFQHYAPDSLVAFQCQALKKAVMCLSYS